MMHPAFILADDSRRILDTAAESTVKNARRVFMKSWHGFGTRGARNGVSVLWAAFLFRAALIAFGGEPPDSLSATSPSGAVYNITLVTDSAPDLTDLCYVRSGRFTRHDY